MGIPSYFSYIVKNHPTIIRRFTPASTVIHNLYMDCNSIIYDTYASLLSSQSNSEPHSIIAGVISRINQYVSLINPVSRVIIAFDGVAPVAKLEQQRQRRHKSWYQNQLTKQIKKDTSVEAWSTTAITAGTKFMHDLNVAVKSHFGEKNGSLIYDLTCSDVAGEGEHKIFDYIRRNPAKHANETTFIYGLDADLIMLCINHLPICPNIFLYRETPDFIKSINSDLEPNENYILDIKELTDGIFNQMYSTNQPANLAKVYDYIFLCFFLGNDFLPHFPAVNIRTGGVDKMLNAYKATIKEDEYLTNGNKIFWGNVRKVVAFLAQNEEQFIREEHQKRNNMERRKLPNKTVEDQIAQIVSIPLYSRALERYINPNAPNWQNRYYDSLLNIDYDNKDRVRQVCVNYLEGLEWTMKYYTSACPDWRWQYNYSYPPLLTDLIQHIPVFDTVFVPENNHKPVSQLMQLCYVLPSSSLSLLPRPFYQKLLHSYPEWYECKNEFVWAYCRYFWESHVQLGHIDLNELEEFISKNRHLLI